MSAASLVGPDFFAFVVDDVESAATFWTDVVGLRQPRTAHRARTCLRPSRSRSQFGSRVRVRASVAGPG